MEIAETTDPHKSCAEQLKILAREIPYRARQEVGPTEELDPSRLFGPDVTHTRPVFSIRCVIHVSHTITQTAHCRLYHISCDALLQTVSSRRAEAPSSGPVDHRSELRK